MHHRYPAKEYVLILVTDGKDNPPPPQARNRSMEEILTQFPDFVPGRDWSLQYLFLEGQYDPELLSCVEKFGENFFDVEKIAKLVRLSEAQVIQQIIEEPQKWVALPIAVSDLVGRVQIRKADEDEWVSTIEARQRLVVGDEIRTGPESMANISFGDAGQVGMLEDTTIRLERSQMDLVTKDRDIGVGMERGTLWNVIHSMEDKPLSYEVVTPIAITAVRGTVFRISIDPGSDTQNVSVVEGRVEVSSLERGFFTDMVPAGAYTNILRGKKPSPQEPLSQKISEEWEKWKKVLLSREPLVEISSAPVHVTPGFLEIVLGPVKPATKEIKEIPLRFNRQYADNEKLVVRTLSDLPPGAVLKCWIEGTEDPLEKIVVVELTGMQFLKHMRKNEYFGKVLLSSTDPNVMFDPQEVDLVVMQNPTAFVDKITGYRFNIKLMLFYVVFGIVLLMAARFLRKLLW